MTDASARSRASEHLNTTDFVVRVRVVGDGEDGDDVVLSQQADQRGDGGVVLGGCFRVSALVVQVTLLVVSWEDAGQHVDAIGLVVKGRLGGEDQEVRAVLTPADLLLQQVKNGGRKDASRRPVWTFSSIGDYFCWPEQKRT